MAYVNVDLIHCFMLQITLNRPVRTSSHHRDQSPPPIAEGCFSASCSAFILLRNSRANARGSE